MFRRFVTQANNFEYVILTVIIGWAGMSTVNYALDVLVNIVGQR